VSYELFRHRALTRQGEWLITLMGKGEHEGTFLTLPLGLLPDTEIAAAAYLDRRFELAHADRLNALAAATGTARTPKAVECEASQSGPKATPNPFSTPSLNPGGNEE
jgi:hypothetical protein